MDDIVKPSRRTLLTGSLAAGPNALFLVNQENAAGYMTWDHAYTRLRQQIDQLPEDPQPGSETELTADETEEALGREIDIWATLREALALALPAYPRSADVAASDTVYAGPGVQPMTDEDARPFAGLADLRAKLDKDD